MVLWFYVGNNNMRVVWSFGAHRGNKLRFVFGGGGKHLLSHIRIHITRAYWAKWTWLQCTMRQPSNMFSSKHIYSIFLLSTSACRLSIIITMWCVCAPFGVARSVSSGPWCGVTNTFIAHTYTHPHTHTHIRKCGFSMMRSLVSFSNLTSQGRERNKHSAALATKYRLFGVGSLAMLGFYVVN